MLRLLPTLALVLATSARAACPDGVTGAAIDQLLETAERSYGELDTDGFFMASDQARLLIPCVSAVLPTRLAARYHRVEGLRRFTANDQRGSEWALSGAAGLEPDYVFPTELLPANHRLRETYLNGLQVPTRFERLRPPADGDMVFDGVHGPARPVDRATIYQRTSGDGAVSGTWYLMPDNQLPPYAGVPRARNRLFAGAAASGGAAGLTALLGDSARRRFDDRGQDHTLDELKSLRTQTQVYGGLTGVFSTAAVGFVAGAFAVGDK